MTDAQLKSLVEVIAAARTLEQQVVVCDLIAPLSNAERLQVRTAAEAAGVTSMPQTLFFNYQTQTWIE